MPASPTLTSQAFIIGELPPVLFGRAPRLTPAASSGRLLAGRVTPMLDQLFAEREAASFAPHRHSYQFDLGAATLGVEVLRLQNQAADWMSRLDGARDRQKSWSLGARSDFALGEKDRLSVGLATGGDHSLQPRMPVNDPHLTTSVQTFGLSWLHGGRWLSSLGWQQSSGSSHGTTARMVELASGAPLHEKGMRFSLAFLPDGTDDARRTSLGVEGRRASVSSGDLAMIGANRRQDTQTSLFVRTHF